MSTTHPDGTDPAPSVDEAIRRVIADLPAIGKDQTGSGINYRFRGIEQIKAELKLVIADYGVHYAPSLLTDVKDETVTVGGKPWTRTTMIVHWTIYGPRGDSISAVTRGEGQDNSDKASNKAMTVAEKQMLLTVFCVADAEDPDRQRHERDTAPPVDMVTKAGLKGATRDQVAAITALPVDDPLLVAGLTAAWDQRKPGDGPWPLAEAEDLRAHLVADAVANISDDVVGGNGVDLTEIES